MPTELLVAVVGVLGVGLGYFLRPLGELAGEVLRDRREIGQRRDRFQFETLIALGDALHGWRAKGETLTPGGAVDRERIRLLAPRARDAQLRNHLERLLAGEHLTPDPYDESVKRLGEVLRDM